MAPTRRERGFLSRPLFEHERTRSEKRQPGEDDPMRTTFTALGLLAHR